MNRTRFSPKQRRTAPRTMGPLTIVVASLLATTAVLANDADAVNDILGGGSGSAIDEMINVPATTDRGRPTLPDTSAGGSTDTFEAAPISDADWENATPASASAYADPSVLDATSNGATSGTSGNSSNKELWIQHAAPLRNVQLIAAVPKPGEDCAQVIFQRSSALTQRYEASAGQRIRIDLTKTCWIGLRNGSDKRSLVLRVGEGLQQLAITPSPQLLTGRELKPLEKLRLALRPLAVAKLDVSLEVTWVDQLNSGGTVESMTLEFIGPNGG